LMVRSARSAHGAAQFRGGMCGMAKIWFDMMAFNYSQWRTWWWHNYFPLFLHPVIFFNSIDFVSLIVSIFAMACAIPWFRVINSFQFLLPLIMCLNRFGLCFC
jgi:hypothetical protein